MYYYTYPVYGSAPVYRYIIFGSLQLLMTLCSLISNLNMLNIIWIL